MRMKEILEKLEKSLEDRKRYSIYVSESVYKEFSRLTGRKRSRALEELMKFYIKSVKKS